MESKTSDEREPSQGIRWGTDELELVNAHFYTFLTLTFQAQILGCKETGETFIVKRSEQLKNETHLAWRA